MAWEARWGLRRTRSKERKNLFLRQNGLGGPMGIETDDFSVRRNDLFRQNGRGDLFTGLRREALEMDWKVSFKFEEKIAWKQD
jgi:hypothetical protein